MTKKRQIKAKTLMAGLYALGLLGANNTCAQFFVSQAEAIHQVSSLRLGGMDSGGADHLDKYDGVSWFTGDDSIRYCVERSDNFQIPLEDLRTHFRESVFQWYHYAITSVFRGNDRNPQLEWARYPAGVLFQEKCSSDTDVVIYAGKESALASEIRKKYRDPISFIFREAFNEVTARGKGFIWLKSDSNFDWRKGNRMRAVFLHEVGHIFGIPHVEQTIMSRQIVSMLKQSSFLYSKKAININHESSVFGDKFFEQVGVISGSLLQSQKTFEYLTGSAPVGEPRSSLVLDKHGKGNLVFSDDVRSISFKFIYNNNSSSAVQGTMSRSVVTLKKPDKFETYNFGIGYTKTTFGILTGMRGEKYPIILNEGLDYDPILVKSQPFGTRIIWDEKDKLYLPRPIFGNAIIMIDNKPTRVFGSGFVKYLEQ